MRRSLKIAAVLAGVLAAALAAGGVFFSTGAVVEVEIPEGASGQQVARILEAKRVLWSSVGFTAINRLTRLDRKLKPGKYLLRERMLAAEAIYRLVRGGADYVRVTIPEGWRLEQIGDRLEASSVTSGPQFLSFAKSQQWEGYLFPTTYYLSKNMPAEAVARLMREEFDRQVLPVYKASGSPLDLDKVVVMASIIEREAVMDDEKPVVSSVYYNRFAHGMRLEADPTVQYALGHWKKGLTYKDLEIGSPFNTYKNNGMPPAPICSPGLASIKAALLPARTPYIYFVADYKGGHTFHVTHDEFLKAKTAAKKELARQKEELRRKGGRSAGNPP